MSPIHVRIFYPADPVGVVPGGIDTFIRGIIKSAPEDLLFSLVGMSTDARKRPVGRWSTQVLGRRTFDCFPAVGVRDAGQRGRLPLSLRYTSAVLRHRSQLMRGFDVLDFHRPEPSLLFRADQRPKVAYFHQDPAVVSLGASDMLWKHLPGAYQRLEAAAMSRFDRAWCVREPGVQTLRDRYPAKAQQVNFIPTWVDSEVFCPAADAHDRAWQRQTLAQQLGISPRTQWIVSVGRLDTQKDPALMLDAFARVCRDGHDVHWLVVGDGKLRPEIGRMAAAAGVADRVHLLGLLSAERIADVLRAADLFALSSAYEGMPMAVLEALGCGLPVVTTDVGEVQRVVRSGINGLVVSGRSPQAFAHALVQGLIHAPQWRGAPAVAATADYQPAAVLAGAYDAYRELGAPVARLRDAVAQQRHDSASDRRRRAVVGVPIDQFSRQAARGRLLHWAGLHESRSVNFCNVHSVVEARRNERHRLVIAGADMALPDGAPVAWTLSWKGRRFQPRLDGPGTMWALCADAQAQGLKIGLYGATEATLAALQQRLRKAFPLLHIAFVHAPPFRELSAQEDAAVCEEIRVQQVGLLFVGLGCPKQERWIAEHRGRIPAVMLGVGAAFDMHAGLARRAPAWVRGIGLEWLHRLAQEPGRLWQRYLSTNSRFVALTLADALGRSPAASEIPQSAATLPGPAGRTAPGSGELARQRLLGRIGIPARPAPDSVTAALDQPTVVLPPHQDSTIMNSQLTRMDDTAVDELVARVDAMLPPRGCRVIEFVASGRGEGTSTIATQFASAHALQWQRKVLLLSLSRRGAVMPSVLQALDAGDPVGPLITRRADGVYGGTLGPATRRHPAWSLLRRNDLWAELRQEFDLVVLDMPSSDVSRAAFNVAPLADGVVVVVEAERARAPVVHDLIDKLRAVRGNVMGTVLNKRRYHLPALLYRWL